MRVRLPDGGVIALEATPGMTVMQALEQIAAKEPQLGFKSGCQSGVCGCCAVRVNGREVLACSTPIQEGDEVSALRFVQSSDLATKSSAQRVLERSEAWLLRAAKGAQKPFLGRASDCILCGSCHSVCPVYETGIDFLGPYALSRVWRYCADEREEAKREHLEAVQTLGIWDCTLCGYCSLVCPQGIDPKGDIVNLRSRSIVVGFEDPNAAAMGNMSFGFNPNQGF